MKSGSAVLLLSLCTIVNKIIVLEALQVTSVQNSMMRDNKKEPSSHLSATIIEGDDCPAMIMSIREHDTARHSSTSKSLRNVVSALRGTFLPRNYPEKTPPGYLRYCMWNWVQDLSTQLRSVLATTRVLEGVGVGRAEATAISAAIQFIIRDGAGMASSLIFTAFNGSYFYKDIKKWRIFADSINDIGITVEVASVTLVPKSFFLPMICFGSVCKSMCGVAAGAVGGAIDLYWASAGSDISDISAKFRAQNIVTGSLGLIFAALFAQSISTASPVFVWCLYSVLTFIHILANMKCMRLIVFDSFNTCRLEIVIDEYLKTAKKNLLYPSEVAKIEPLVFLPFHRSKVQYGVSYEQFMKLVACGNQAKEKVIYNELVNKGYACRPSSCNKFTLVLLHRNISNTNRLKAFFEAQLRARGVGLSDDEMEEYWIDFEQTCKVKGWKMDKSTLKSQGFEILTGPLKSD